MTTKRVPNIVRGGVAIPLKNKTNYYYMAGRKHSQGGIDVGDNPRTGLEVEDGEVMHISKNDVKVFSSVPFLNGKSPAQKVMGGENPNNVFKAQESFKRKNKINDDGTKKKRMGGLSRSKDYGSKSKPYPNVKSEDFAGGGRSYPIPTKADAIDALRLAGLHGRSDVKAKVYNKYPELRKKSKAGGVYTVTSNGKTSLRMIPSTGGLLQRDKAKLGKYDKNNVSTTVINDNRPIITPTRPNLASMAKPIDNSKIVLPTKIKEKIKDNNYTDALGLTSNIVGSLLSHSTNKNMLNKLRYSDQPIARNAAKLKTNININPQLDKMRETLAVYERDIDNNTASSNVALARKQRGRLANILSTNELYGNKENAETELINKDKLNQQAIAHANISEYNKWKENKAAFDNAIAEKKSENDVSLINNINTGIQDIINRREKRNSENKTIATMAFANPNLPIELFHDMGIINNKTYKGYIKAYRNRKRNNKD